MTGDETAVAALSAFPAGVTDPFCPDGHVVTETPDRRLLWHLERCLAGVGFLHETYRALAVYLRSTCTHHWHDHDADAGLPGFRQCLWCSTVEWSDL